MRSRCCRRATARPLSALLLLLIAAATAPGPSCTAHAQGRDDDVAQIVSTAGEQYARGYATGLVEATSAALGSGLFFESGQDTDILGPLNVYVGARWAVVPVREEERTFSLNRTASGQIRLSDGTLREVEYSYRVASAPTALAGDQQPRPETTVTARYRDTSGELQTEEFTFTAPQGLLGYLSFFPSGVPQVGVGVPALGLRVSARFTPTIAYEDKGQGSLYGVGLRHSLGAWFDSLPVGISVYGYYQHIGLTEGRTDQHFLDFSLLSGGLNLSKSVIAEPLYSLSLFAGIGAETSTAHFTYETAQAGTTFSSVIDFDLKNALRLRGRTGFSTRFGPLLLNFGYAPFPRSAFSGGLGLSI